MTPQLLTYLLAVIPLALLGIEFYTYNKNKKNGHGFVLKPFKLAAYAFVLVLAVYAIVTGQTYEDIVTRIEGMV
ncbi:hypothetical protein I6N95_03185 [Vagococcus sp. BWB3-3]|uniref:Uncharacterized protein n=1 Tax=Vagococcus allomyrinae TaxID=2794353 RepID=A0A940P213_9ENTE|nr:hypothetical protein [Vagococcus allomyrinae]MBP1040009.1 hypothetical protein [Vagococcus allomyrinae]